MLERINEVRRLREECRRNLRLIEQLDAAQRMKLRDAEVQTRKELEVLEVALAPIDALFAELWP